MNNEIIKKVKIEKQELDEKLDKLDQFIDTEKFFELEDKMQRLLRAQKQCMYTYSRILGERLDLLEEDK